MRKFDRYYKRFIIISFGIPLIFLQGCSHPAEPAAPASGTSMGGSASSGGAPAPSKGSARGIADDAKHETP